MKHPTDPGHRRLVMAAMLAAGALVAQQVAGRATRDALFLSSFSVSWLPLVMIGSALASGLAVFVFSSAISRHSPARAVPRALVLATLLLLTEWGLSLFQARLAALAVYLHLAVFGAPVVSGFWSLVNELFDPYTARRVMGRIGLGASFGGVMGGLLAWGVASLIPVPAMLALMGGLNVVCLVALGWLRQPAPPPRHERPPSLDPGAGPWAGVRLLGSVPYLRNLALFVALGAAMEAFLDYLLNAQAAGTFPAGHPLMSFFALFHMGTSLLGLAAQTTLSRPALQGLGLAGTVALRPAVVLASTVVGVLNPGLWTALLARGAQGVLTNSLFRSGYELLFTPLPERRKRPTKAVIDVAVDRLGTVGGGLATLLLVWWLGSGSIRVLYALAGVGAVAALALARQLHRGYVSALEEGLRSGALRHDAADLIDATTFMTLAQTGLTLGRQDLLREVEALRQERQGGAGGEEGDVILQAAKELRSGEIGAVRQALRRFDELPPELVGNVIPLLARNDLFLDALRALRRAATRATGQLVDALLDPGQDPAVRRRIPRALRGSPTQRAVDGLLSGLADPLFEVRRQCARTLARLTALEPRLEVPRATVFAAALRELEAGSGAWGGEGSEAHEHRSGPDADPSEKPEERGIGHVFTLLSLTLEREPTRIASWAVRGEDAALRGTALEYLDNVLPDSLRLALWPHLGLPVEPNRLRRSRQQVEEELLRSGDRMADGRRRRPPR